MSVISRALYFFTPYTDVREQVVDRFFKSLTEHSSHSATQTRLGRLLQHDIAVINLWTEYRYKGYKYLTKSERKKLYTNLQLIALDFDRFCLQALRPQQAVVEHIHRIAPNAVVDPHKVVLLQAIMDYLSPGRGTYEYRSTSSFGRLLRNPVREKLVGDCNQIVTLYIYLYGRHYSVQDLRVRTLPGHVALHYSGIDIEATNATFANYAARENSSLLPIEEIVSINLLDMTDSYLSTHEVAAEDLLQASRFAFILSHSRETVAHNLKAAYQRVTQSLMERHNYTKALAFATASHDATLLSVVGHNGAVHEMERHNYAAARKFAEYATKREALLRSSWHAEGNHHYQEHRFLDAIKAYEHTGDQSLINRCYEALYFQEQKKLGKNLNSATIKNYASVIQHMHTYAKKSGNEQLIAHTASLQKHL